MKSAPSVESGLYSIASSRALDASALASARRALVAVSGLAIAGSIFALLFAVPNGAITGFGIWLVDSSLVFSIGLLGLLIKWPLDRLAPIASGATAYFAAYLSASAIHAVFTPHNHDTLFASLIWFTPLQAFNKTLNVGKSARILGRVLLVAPLLIVGLLSPQIVQIFPPSLTGILAVFLLAHVSVALLLDILWRYREAFIGEKERSESFRFASEILESISESFILVDGAFRLLYVNAAACAVLKVQRANVEGKPAGQALPRFISPLISGAMERAWNAKQPQQFEARSEGDGRRFEIRCAPGQNDMFVYFRDVTERHATEEKLRHSETQLRMAGQLIRMGAWECGFPNGPVIWSDQVAAIHEKPAGFSPEIAEAIAFYAPEWRPKILEILQECARSGASFDEELQIVTAHGRRVWVRAIGQAIRNPDGAVTGAQGAFQDIDTRKLAEEETTRLAKRLETTLESITDAVFTVDFDWRFTYLNSAAESWLRPQGELLGHVLWEAFPEFLVGSFHENFQSAVRTNRKVAFEESYVPAGARWSLNAFPSADGLSVYFQDVTTQRAAQEALRVSQLRLVEQAEVLDKATDSIMVRDIDGRIRFWNQSSERLYGLSSQEVVGRPVHEVLGVERAVSDEATAKVLESGSWRRVLSATTKDGRLIVVDIHLSLIRDEAGDPKSILAISTDITERVAIEQRLRQSERLDAVGQLTGGVAHDFNNLLTVILGNAGILVEELADREDLRGLAEMMKGAAERGAALTNRLLAFARSQALEPRATDLHVLLSDMHALLLRTLRKDIQLVLIEGNAVWHPLVDPAQLENAVLNLCLNARDAMPQGGRLAIETANIILDQSYVDGRTEVTPGEYVMVAVSDNGAGIAPEHRDRVFDPFFTTKEFGKGTGLGLSMVYGFVKQSQGHIAIYSEPGRGTTVKMYLPRTTDAPRVADVASVNLGELGGSETILVVEDDEMVRRSVERHLTSLGYRVITAATGLKGLEAIKSSLPVDLLLTDVIMPGGLDGPALARAARAFRPALRVLYTSGYTESAIFDEKQLEGGIQLLNKPYARAELARKVRAALAETPR